MKTTLSTLACLIITIGMCGQSSAQFQPGIVAVLDVAEVFKENTSFNTQLNAIRNEAKSLNDQFQSRMKQLQENAQGLSIYNPGTPERRAKEAELEQEQTKIRTQYRQANEDLLNREAALYHRTYLDLQSVVQRLAMQHGISMVLRFDRSQVNPDIRPEVVKVVNRAVVYQKNLDLTDMVIKEMVSKATAGIPQNVK